MSELEQLKWDNNRLKDRCTFDEIRASRADDLLMIIYNRFYGDGLGLNLKHKKLTGEQIHQELKEYLIEYCY